MQKQLDEIIQQYKNSQTTLEAYKAISDFVKIIETFSEFVEEAEILGLNKSNSMLIKAGIMD